VHTAFIITIITLMMGAVTTSEMVISISQTSRHNIPEDTKLILGYRSTKVMQFKGS
jgi:hypothetical protein